MDALITVVSWNTNGIMIWSILLELKRNYGLGMDAPSHRVLLEYERKYDLGMDALVTLFSWNTNGIMNWAWML